MTQHAIMTREVSNQCFLPHQRKARHRCSRDTVLRSEAYSTCCMQRHQLTAAHNVTWSLHSCRLYRSWPASVRRRSGFFRKMGVLCRRDGTWGPMHGPGNSVGNVTHPIFHADLSVLAGVLLLELSAVPTRQCGYVVSCWLVVESGGLRAKASEPTLSWNLILARLIRLNVAVYVGGGAYAPEREQAQAAGGCGLVLGRWSQGR